MADWKEKLTPSDAGIQRMIETHIGMPCEPKNGGNHYYMEPCYKRHNDPQFILGLWDAIEGRVGNRLIRMDDDAERQCLVVRIRFSTEKLPGFVTSDRFDCRGCDEFGDTFCRQMQEVHALQVRRENVERLIAFTGGGEMEVPDSGRAIYHFLNASKSAWHKAPEGTYIVRVRDELFKVVSKEDFERDYARK